MKSSTLKSQSGFSLVELMVVVAIIGILAAMSVGQVQKQIAKARQSEAKSNLAAIYTANSSFRSEFNTYGSNFGPLKIEFSGRMRYRSGWNAAVAAQTVAYYQGYGVPAAQAVLTNFTSGTGAAAAHCGTVAAPAGTCTMLTEAVACATAAATGTTATQNTFIASACSRVYQNTGANADIDEWTIDQNKNIVQANNGIP